MRASIRCTQETSISFYELRSESVFHCAGGNSLSDKNRLKFVTLLFDFFTTNLYKSMKTLLQAYMKCAGHRIDRRLRNSMDVADTITKIFCCLKTNKKTAMMRFNTIVLFVLFVKRWSMNSTLGAENQHCFL